MDQRASDGSDSLRGEDTSMGILNMDKLKGKGKFFGEISYDSFKKGNNKSTECERGINQRLSTERMKALEALQKSEKADLFKKPRPVNHKQSTKAPINLPSSNHLMSPDNTDYVPFRRPNAINISDLVTDETINLESSSSRLSMALKDVKVSFEPNEITGRSTSHHKDEKNRKNSFVGGCTETREDFYKTKKVTVGDILASSFAPKARNLCETLLSDTTLDSNGCQAAALLSSNTSLSSFNVSKSLPRTADMSLSKNTCTEESFNGGFGTLSFSSAGAGTGLDESEFFAPGELMQSKLINDEISWAQEYAAIPTAALSELAKAKVLANPDTTSNGFNSPTTSNSMIAGDPNFSVGNFFNMRSDSIRNIVKFTSPKKRRTPVALVGEDDNTVTTTTSLEGSSRISVTPKIDNKTYTRVGASATQLEKEKFLHKLNPHPNQESNSTDSYLLSLSAIDRALCDLDLHSSASGIGLSEQLLMQGKKLNACMNTDKQSMNTKTIRDSLEKTIGNESNLKKTVIEEMILENKENLDPCIKQASGGAALSDTISFSESLLNSSDMKTLERSFAQPRSPLSPIDLNTPSIRVINVPDDGEEADNDDWPGTPITNNKRIRRKKSPRDKSPLKTNVDKSDYYGPSTPVNSAQTKNRSSSEKEPKSLSSTRLDGDNTRTNDDCDFAVSPSICNERNNISSLVVRSNTLGAQQIRSPTSGSPCRLVNSPTSSPCSYHLSQAQSPTPTTIEFASPNLDSTSRSDRNLLNADIARKVISSPVGSESSSTCSYRPHRSALSTASGRSVSRCSSSSEFSHRDGKPIPFKVTNIELSWGSIKLRNGSRKSMQIKNIINKRLVLRIEVSGPGFQIENSQRSNTITLHSQECRTISICFCPTVCGVAIGKLSFYGQCGTTTSGSSLLDVPLYGYGGNASIVAQNIFMGPVGAPFVTMGDVCELAQPLERVVSFYNKGPLLGFASVNIDSIGLMIPRLSDAFEIHPRKILIPPKHMVDVRIVFRPKREEIRKIIKKMGSVLTLANLRVICGDEANRQRIRRLIPQMSEEQRCKLSSSSLDMLWGSFPQEMEINDLAEIKEDPTVVMDLLSFFRIHEILLTINHDNMDDTFEASSIILADVDETVLFRTICTAADSPIPTTNLDTVDEVDEYNAELVLKTTKPNTWSVSPETINIDLNKQMPIILHIHNGYKSRQFFEIVCNIQDLFYFKPSDGYVAPDGGHTEVHITRHAKFKRPSESVYIMVYMESERVVVPVNIIK